MNGAMEDKWLAMAAWMRANQILALGIQEHKLTEVGVAQEWESLGLEAHLTPATKGPNGGAAGGVGVVFCPEWAEKVDLRIEEGQGPREAVVSIAVGGKERIFLHSIYSNTHGDVKMPKGLGHMVLADLNDASREQRLAWEATFNANGVKAINRMGGHAEHPTRFPLGIMGRKQTPSHIDVVAMPLQDLAKWNVECKEVGGVDHELCFFSDHRVVVAEMWLHKSGTQPPRATKRETWRLKKVKKNPASKQNLATLSRKSYKGGKPCRPQQTNARWTIGTAGWCKR